MSAEWIDFLQSVSITLIGVTMLLHMRGSRR